MKYNSFSYIYPPRPKNAVNPIDINNWDDNTMVAQPKLNGSNVTIYMNGEKIYVYNRHGKRMSNFNLLDSELLKLYRGNGWLVLNGEYLNKSRNDENNDLFNIKLVLFDILVYNSNYLIGTTFQERITLLDTLYGSDISTKSYLYDISDNIYRVVSYYNYFEELYNDLSKIDLIEGIVLKRRLSKLEVGYKEDNNSKSQVKFRKQCKMYKF